jgi:diadenosine tetraphosphate (Ap4A) HIT family hydrolase
MNNFLDILKTREILYKDEYFTIIEDSFPVSPGHLLIISNIVVENYFLLQPDQIKALNIAIFNAKMIIESKYKPDGYNIGMNCGESAGQTVFHFHCHLIPRYKNDTPNPKGGVRHCIPGKGNY